MSDDLDELDERQMRRIISETEYELSQTKERLATAIRVFTLIQRPSDMLVEDFPPECWESVKLARAFLAEMEGK